MKAKDIMTTHAVSCGPETTLQEAAKKMHHANCGALPVIDKNKKVLGIITDRDICISLAKDEHLPSSRTIRDIMSPNVYTVETTDTILTVLRTMQDNKVGRLPVINEEKQLEGIISLYNVINKATGPDASVKIPGDEILTTVKALSSRYSNQYKAQQELTA